MRIPTEHFRNVPVVLLSPSLMSSPVTSSAPSPCHHAHGASSGPSSILDDSFPRSLMERLLRTESHVSITQAMQFYESSFFYLLFYCFHIFSPDTRWAVFRRHRKCNDLRLVHPVLRCMDQWQCQWAVCRCRLTPMECWRRAWLVRATVRPAATEIRLCREVWKVLAVCHRRVLQDRTPTIARLTEG